MLLNFYSRESPSQVWDKRIMIPNINIYIYSLKKVGFWNGVDSRIEFDSRIELILG